jgi:4-hydroxybenzoyl-CoA thioesterase
MSEVFRTSAKVRFAHCDAAGIIFYPRAFELVNGVVEDWFAEALEKPFRALHLEDGLGAPLVKLEAEFVSPIELGDMLDFGLVVTTLGRSSADLEVAAHTNGGARLHVRARIVFTNLAARRSIPIPDALRARMKRYLR